MLVFVFVITFLAVLGLFSGEILFYLKLRNKYFSQRSTWTATEGKVTYAKIKHHGEETGGDNAKPEEWTVWVEFSYNVAGKTYSAGQDWASRFPSFPLYSVGSVVTVYFNPGQPKKGVVNRNINRDEIWWGAWLFAALWVLTMGLLVFLPLYLAATL
jgi:hypothetical protein